MTQATNPASSGPAGTHFEGQVAANYLLSMLVGAEPRGLPGATFDRVQLQRGADGFPLDDVIVHAHSANGSAAILEVQVKRSITFAPTDPVFQKVVAQIARSSECKGFWERNHQLAVATSQTSRQISGSYQDLLTWARELESGAMFFSRINRKYSGNDDMRGFVRTFQINLKKAGTAHLDEDVWRLLRRIQIHVYDFTATGSASEELARERAVRALHSEDTPKATILWKSLVELSIGTAAVGGERSRAQLVDELGASKFRLVGDTRLKVSRDHLAESTDLALSDIEDSILNVSIGRQDRVAKIREEIDKCRYLEIRGEAGVGKSGLLKHFAQMACMEGRCILLSPNRTIPRGWIAMRQAIDFPGTAKELLQDLAADGGGYLFIDNLDFFSEEEKTTVKDLVREAASVPGMIVIATARMRLSTEYVDWLPKDALDDLGRGDPFVVDELAESEIEELREADPRLSSLLAEEHPAKAVTRNLFRLGRLTESSEGCVSPRSEVEMANQWWTTADGQDAGRRERFRLLRELAARSLRREQVFNVSDQPPAAIDALVRSGTLRDLKNDKVAFRHDVLKEWAIAHLLILQPVDLKSFELHRPASPELARGLELASRIALETSRDIPLWRDLLATVSKEEHHKSWRRVALLGIVHSEIAGELIRLNKGTLIADDGLLLREILRLVMAVDVRPARLFFEKHNLEFGTLPEGLTFPGGSSWGPLVVWLLEIEPEIPRKCIPDVVEFFAQWTLIGALIKDDPLTTAILTHFQRWLINLETVYESSTWKGRHEVFGGILKSDELDRLEEKLHATFIMFANRVPHLASEYLKSVQQRRNKDRIYSKLLKFRGSLAQAAPAELAAITLDALVSPKKKVGEWDGGYRHREALTHLDSQFYPESPAQGPFYELLKHSPTHGLGLIRSLVQAVVSFQTKAVEDTPESIPIVFPEGERHFPWVHTYGWSRNSHHASVTSALMALEYWGHERLENGDAIATVVKEMLGDQKVPAAFLLPVVDILISHWPASGIAAVPFVASPELLVADQPRPTRDEYNRKFEFPDIFGIEALKREPAGPKLETLESRVSRHYSLKDLLVRYAQVDFKDIRPTAEKLLIACISRLGLVQPEDDLGFPRFMATHALNLLEPTNYRDIEVELKDGRKVQARHYVPPKEELEHFARIQGDAHERSQDAEFALFVDGLIDHPERSSPEMAEKLIPWVKTKLCTEFSFEPTNALGLDHTIVGAVFVAMRDGAAILIQENRDWAESIFKLADNAEPDDVRVLREGVRFNPIAMAFAGRVFLMNGTLNHEVLRRLLETVVADASAAHGAAVAVEALVVIDERLPRSLLRVAFTAAIQSRHQWDSPEVVKVEAEKLRQDRLQQAVESEIDWLISSGLEPGWPMFPTSGVSKRRRTFIRLGKSREASEDETSKEEAAEAELAELPDVFVHHQAGALWLRSVWNPSVSLCHDVLRTVIENYSNWTFIANGLDISDHEEVSHPPREWNDAFFRLMAQYVLDSKSRETVNSISLLASLPEDSFFEITTIFLRAFDEACFNRSIIDVEFAVKVRTLLAERLIKTRGWSNLRGTESDGVEHRLGPAGATFFFNNLPFGEGPKCYLLEKAALHSSPFLPILEKLAKAAPSPFVAMILLNWLEVAPRIDQISAILTFSSAALVAYPDSRNFWIDKGIGRRICKWLEIVLPELKATFSDNDSVRTEVERILSLLVAIGVAEAKSAEERLHECS